MKLRNSILFAMLIGIMLAFTANVSQAALLGLQNKITSPIASFLKSTTTSTSYSPTTHLFAVSTTPTYILLSSTSVPAFFSASPLLNIQAPVDNSGNIIPTSATDRDLVVTGTVTLNSIQYVGTSTVPLLTGRIAAFGFLDQPATDTYEFKFIVTGGLLKDAGLFGGTAGLILTSEGSTFASNFGVSFTGKSKGTLGVVPIPAIKVEETCVDASAPDQPMTFTVTLTNTGNESLAGISCLDANGAALSGFPTTLAPNALPVTVPFSFTPTTTPYKQTVTCSATGAISTIAVSSNSSASCNVLTNPGFKIYETCTNAAAPGQPITVQGVLTNTGNEILTGFSCSSGNGVTLAGIPSTLAIGSTDTVTGSYIPTVSNSDNTISCSAKGILDNMTVTASSSATCNIITAPAITLAETCTDASAPGQPISLTATLTNSGNEPLTAISCIDSNGAVLTGVPATLPPFGSVGNSATITGNYIPLASGSADTITCSAKGSINSVTVSASSSATCNIITAPAITVTETCSNASAPDKPIVFTATVSNTGNEALTGVSCTDTLGTTLAVANIPVGASNSVTFSYIQAGSPLSDTVTCSAKGSINSATVSATSGPQSCSIIYPAIEILKYISSDGKYWLHTDPSNILKIALCPTCEQEYDKDQCDYNHDGSCDERDIDHCKSNKVDCDNQDRDHGRSKRVHRCDGSSNKAYCDDRAKDAHDRNHGDYNNDGKCDEKDIDYCGSYKATCDKRDAEHRSSRRAYRCDDSSSKTSCESRKLVEIKSDKARSDYNNDGKCDENDIDYCKGNRASCDQLDKDLGNLKRRFRCDDSSNNALCEDKSKEEDDKDRSDFNNDGRCDDNDIDYCKANRATCELFDRDHGNSRRKHRCDDSADKNACEEKARQEHDRDRCDYNNDGKCNETDVSYCKGNKDACEKHDRAHDNCKRTFRCDDSSNRSLCESNAQAEHDRDHSDYNHDGKCDEKDVDLCKGSPDKCDKHDKDHGLTKRSYRCDDSSSKDSCASYSQQQADKDRSDYNRDGKCDENDMNFCKANSEDCVKHDKNRANLKRSYRCDDSSGKTACEASRAAEEQRDKDNNDYNRDGKCDERDVDYCRSNKAGCDKFDSDRGKNRRAFRCDDSSNKTFCESKAQTEHDRDYGDYNRDGKCDEKDIDHCKGNSDDCDKHDRVRGGRKHSYRCEDSSDKTGCESRSKSENDWYEGCIATGGTSTSCGKVYFKFVVKDSGTTNLNNITLTDSVYSLSSCTIPATLAPDASFTCVVGPFAAQAGQHMNVGTATGTFDGVTVSATDNAYYFGCNGTEPKSPGYWKNHPEAWPVASITIGGTVYTKAQAISFMDSSVSGDKTYTLFKALVAAKLNGLGCSDSSCITADLLSADAWMTAHSVGSGVTADSAAWVEAEPLYMTLDDYDNGKSCGGTTCSQPVPPVPPVATCGQCGGGVTKLTLMYKGSSTVTVELKDSSNRSLYKSTAAPNSSFTVTGKASNGTMGQYVKVYVNGNYKATIYTDCSKSIYPGLGVGSFTVVEGFSLNGGKFCRVAKSSCTNDDDSRYSRDYCDSHRGESSCSDFFDYSKGDSYRSSGNWSSRD